MKIEQLQTLYNNYLTLYCTPPYINYANPEELAELGKIIEERETNEIRIRRVIAKLEDHTADLDEKICKV